MQLEAYEFVNWCQHRRMAGALRPGLTAVIGANGSGKSNFLGGIRFSLTGDNPNSGTKEDNICQRADPSENAYTRLQFSHANVRAVVTRYLRPTGRKDLLELTTLGATAAPESIRGDRNVNTRITQLLGLDMAAIHEIVLVAQEDIFGFLAQRPAQRQAAFQRLFHTEAATETYTVLGAHIGAIPAIPVLANVDEIRQQLETARQAWNMLGAEAGRLPELEALYQAQREDDAVLAQAAQQTTLREQLQQVASLRGQYATQAQLLTASAEATSENVTTLTDAAQGVAEAADAAQQLLRDMESYRTIADSRAELDHLMRRALQQLESLRVPTRPANYCTDLPDLNGKLQELHRQILRDEQLLRDLDDGRKPECPTCHTRVADGLNRVVEAARAGLPAKRTWRQELMDSERATREYDAAHATYTSRSAELNRELERLRSQDAALARAQPPVGDPVALRETIRAHGEYTAAAAEYRQQLQREQTELARLRGLLSAYDEQQQQLQTTLASLTVVPEHARAAQQRATDRQVQLTRRRELDAALVTQRDLVGRLETQLQQLTQQAAANQVNAAWRQRVEAMRSVVHWSALPTWVIRRNLQRLSVSTNDTLSRFQTDFRVEADESLSFRAHFTDGRVQPAERLSWGQKVVLALAVRVALNLTVASGVGLLGLDEPTAYLDQHHIRGFTPVMERLRAFAASSGLQCLMVTHEASLGPLFDQVIQI